MVDQNGGDLPGKDISRELSSGDPERASREIDQFISKRHQQRLKTEPKRQMEASWLEAERCAG
jgi:hypothetical protein